MTQSSASLPHSTVASDHGPRESAGMMLVLTGAVLWGAGGVGVALVADNSTMSWSAIAATRMLLAGAIMGVLIVGARGVSVFTTLARSRVAVLHVLISSVLMAATGVSYYMAIGRIGVSASTVVTLGSAPVAVALAMSVLGRALPSAGTLTALVVALVGLVLVGGAPSTAAGSGRDMALGCLLSVISGSTFASMTVMNRRSVAGLTPSTLVALSFAFGGMICLLPGASGLRVTSMTATAWAGMAAAVLFHGVLGYFLYYAGLYRGVPPTTAAIASLAEPCTAVVLSLLILGERLNWLAVLGMALIMSAVVVCGPDHAAETSLTALGIPETPDPPGPTEASTETEELPYT